MDAGGSGQDTTSAFDVHERNVRVDYRLVQMPSNHGITFTLEREDESGGFQSAGGATDVVPDGLAGSKTLPTNPGRYRLRVEAETTWSAVLYETK